MGSTPIAMAVLVIIIPASMWIGRLAAISNGYEKIEIKNAHIVSSGGNYVVTIEYVNTGSASTSINNILINGVPYSRYRPAVSLGGSFATLPSICEAGISKTGIISFKEGAEDLGGNQFNANVTLAITLYTVGGNDYQTLVALQGSSYVSSAIQEASVTAGSIDSKEITVDPDVGIYLDNGCSQALNSIDWGMADPGTIKNTTVYIKNEGSVPITLSLSTSNWNPANAADYISLSWDYNGQAIDSNQVVQVTISLLVSSNIQGIKMYSFDVVISSILSILGLQGSQGIKSYGVISYQQQGLSYLHTEGRLIKNEFGEVVILRGCAKMCMEFVADPDAVAYNITKEDFESIKNFGANIVRIDLAYSLLFPSTDVNHPDTTYLSHIDNIVTWCGELGIYVLLDCHGYYPQQGAPPDFWDTLDKGIKQPYRDNIRDFWLFLANRYKGIPTVFGFDLYNEPWCAVPEADRPSPYEWKILIEEWIDAVRTINPKLVFVVENAGRQHWGQDDWRWLYTNPVNRTNVIYSPHFYPQSPTGEWKDWGWIELYGSDFTVDYATHNYEIARKKLATYLSRLYTNDLNYPFMIGEFSTFDSDAGLRCLQDMIEIFEQHGWSWIYWAWCGRPQPSYMLVLENWVTLSPQGQIVHRKLTQSEQGNHISG
jgi:aryl-phospho-beta-D-glucosidase BglC (GH1 family)